MIRTSSIVSRLMPRIVLTSGSDGNRDPTPIMRCEPWYEGRRHNQGWNTRLISQGGTPQRILISSNQFSKNNRENSLNLHSKIKAAENYIKRTLKYWNPKTKKEINIWQLMPYNQENKWAINALQSRKKLKLKHAISWLAPYLEG